MNLIVIGVLMGVIFVVLILLFGFWGFFFVVLFMGIGVFVGWIMLGQFDVCGFVNVFFGWCIL